ncbi:MAG TPA: hypothetical protein VNX67_03775 [Solirubrobacteraceae bacterium]|nr:hypothetical protein [Solirubrobacteraceae bacterium]
MSIEDETQQSTPDPASTPGKHLRAWMRWIGGASRQAQPEPTQTPTGLDRIDITTLQALPALLDRSSLPNGVLELVIEDFEEPTRQLLDIHDGHITLVDPGQCVPWASISGPPAAWASALGPERDTAALRLTGDAQLALRVLAALPSPA